MCLLTCMDEPASAHVPFPIFFGTSEAVEMPSIHAEDHHHISL